MIQIESILRQAISQCIDMIARTHFPATSDLFNSPEVTSLKEEIVRTGRKLWERQYVDGNGGNISVRVSPQYVLCTPTLCSKADLRIEDLCLVDLNNSKICGETSQTSEILLHLEIYKSVPQAKAVIHCHPPYATAHAIAGVIPQGNLIPEEEVFVGPVALSPYETPGTQQFAETVLPFVRNHNTILLANHGVVCWADTVSHAEWYVEIVDTYCKTVMLAKQLKPVLNEIPPHKIQALLTRKKKLGLPDARFAECNPSEPSDPQESLRSQGTSDTWDKDATVRRPDAKEVEALVTSLARQITSLMGKVD